MRGKSWPTLSPWSSSSILHPPLLHSFNNPILRKSAVSYYNKILKAWARWQNLKSPIASQPRPACMAVLQNAILFLMKWWGLPTKALPSLSSKVDWFSSWSLCYEYSIQYPRVCYYIIWSQISRDVAGLNTVMALSAMCSVGMLQHGESSFHSPSLNGYSSKWSTVWEWCNRKVPQPKVVAYCQMSIRWNISYHPVFTENFGSIM